MKPAKKQRAERPPEWEAPSEGWKRWEFESTSYLRNNQNHLYLVDEENDDKPFGAWGGVYDEDENSIGTQTSGWRRQQCCAG